MCYLFQLFFNCSNWKKMWSKLEGIIDENIWWIHKPLYTGWNIKDVIFCHLLSRRQVEILKSPGWLGQNLTFLYLWLSSQPGTAGGKNHNIDGPWIKPIVKYWKHFFLDTINLPCTGSEERAEYKRKMFKVSRRAQVHTSIDV